MQVLKGKATVIQLQWLAWISFYVILFFTYLPMGGLAPSAVFPIINCLFYAVIIYGNILFLFPRFYQHKKYITYVLLVILFLLLTGLGRGYVSSFIHNRYFVAPPDKIEPITFLSQLKYSVAGILIFALSFIFRIAIAYFKLKQQTEEIMVQKSQAELNLLKSQVQPHFLFNTLNNIYYEAYREAPRTAALIERLSDIMRYFVDESPQDDVAITTEVKFIENYIELEKIRIRHEVQVEFKKDFDQNLRIPPMLLMTFVENIFKHGIDKSSLTNSIKISLIQQDGYLLFETSNLVHKNQKQADKGGFGVANLRKRLTLLYQTNFELTVNKNDLSFTAFLKIPIA